MWLLRLCSLQLMLIERNLLFLLSLLFAELNLFLLNSNLFLLDWSYFYYLYCFSYIIYWFLFNVLIFFFLSLRLSFSLIKEGYSSIIRAIQVHTLQSDITIKESKIRTRQLNIWLLQNYKFWIAKKNPNLLLDQQLGESFDFYTKLRDWGPCFKRIWWSSRSGSNLGGHQWR